MKAAAWALGAFLGGCLLPDVQLDPTLAVGGVGLDAGGSNTRRDGGVDSEGGAAGSRSTGEACRAALDCISRRCDAGRCAAASCDDSVSNQDETGLDCGGTTCRRRCAVNLGCKDDGDCASGLICLGTVQSCSPASCGDGILTSPEILMDCGGGTCPGCPAGTSCTTALDCESRVCATDGRCATASCTDGLKNQDETGVDCGGSCGTLCQLGKECAANAECVDGLCASGNCDAAFALCCQAASCSDGQLNGTETATDCGGSDPLCARCADTLACAVDSDCANFNCLGLCVSCGDNVFNGTETDVDCGGSDPACTRCEPGAGCVFDQDCQSGACEGGRCCGGMAVDCTRCARRLAPSVTCDMAEDATGAANCEAFLDCLARNPAACPVRFAEGCSIDPGGVCNHVNFGGNGGTGLMLADAILGAAACFF